ncbi:MAG: glyoxalase/bleomycin resistance/dioxygenase family protein [Rubritepida sp.]|nr:glyoxalase/bleomycin resistance/dioxygenase family protein [Rubritepida sp.]
MSLREIRNFHYAVLLCDRLEATREFYRDVLQLPVETNRGNWVSFRVGAALLSLRRRGVWSVCDDGKAVPGSAAVQLAFRVPPPAVDACHAELVAKSVPILRAPTDLPDWRHRTLFFRDPEDNIIEIYAEYQVSRREPACPASSSRSPKHRGARGAGPPDRPEAG